MVTGTEANASASSSTESSPTQLVQFDSSGHSMGLPGGDMHQSRVSPSNPSVTKEPILAIMPGTSDSADTVPDAPVGPPLDENAHKYVGLVNQAMTCYLNSLVQSLYMTPEFRNAMYSWEYRSSKGGQVVDSSSSIPCQIQKLFLQLQTTDRDSLETKDLTASFGWHSNEAYDQHDVQELCRLMFDALEIKWKGSKQEKLIEQLYRGTMQDFVKCLTCQKENIRPDFFLDLPLAVKPFGASEAFTSVEEALRAFVSPELLSGSNQYHCESCNSKQDAHKGLRVTKFPYLLTIQLKRFDFDYNTMHRIKLNDKVTFPDVLDLNSFVHDPSNQDRDTESRDVVHVGRPIDKEEVAHLLKRGPYVYELFSVMVHQGSAAGGHYFAYIKNMQQDRWYCFNDTRVEAVSPAEVERSFGGSTGGWSSSNTNAYMLMYRQLDAATNANFLATDQLPQHISRLQQMWAAQEEDKERQRLYQISLVNVRVRLNMICDHEALLDDEFKFELPRTQLLSDVFNSAAKFFEEKCKEYGVPFVRTKGRLIRMDRSNARMVEAFVSKADLSKKLETCMGQFSKDLDFLFDARAPTSSAQPFLVQREHPGTTIALQRVDIASRIARPAYLLNVMPNQKAVLMVKTLIGAAFGESQRELVEARLVLQKRETGSGDLVLLDSPGALLCEQLKECYTNIPTLYYDGGFKRGDEAAVSAVVEDRKKKLTDSIMFEILDRKKFAMNLRILLPSDEEVAKAASASSAFNGPSWSETMKNANSTEKPLLSADLASYLPSSNVPSSSASLSPSSASLNGSESASSTQCVTPQMSPNVSDIDEGIGGEADSSACLSPSDIAMDIGSDVGCQPSPSVNSIMSYSQSEFSSTSTLVAGSAGDGCPKIVLVEKDEKNIHLLDVDSRIYVSTLKNWLAERLHIDASQFVITKHHQEDLLDKGYELGGRDDDKVANAFHSIAWLSIKLRPPLREDEKLIRIIQFDMEEHNRENWKVLFDVPASQNTLIGDVLLQCLRLYREIYGENLQRNQIRLRDMASNQRPQMNPCLTLGTRVHHQWSNNIYMQIITEERNIDAPGFPVLVRRFRPSTVESGPIHEVMVDEESAPNPLIALRQAISSVSGIPLDHLEVTEPPNSMWDSAKWPFAKSRLDLLDGNIRFVQKMDSTANYLEKVASRVIYYRDNQEKPKVLTEDERKQITIKDNTSPNSTALRRKERPLRIQMSSISES